MKSLTGLVVALALAGSACGSGSSTKQAEARDRATTESCNWYRDACKVVGPGLMYPTFSDCEIDVRAKWNTAWPAAECDGKIKQSELEICLTAIHATDCTSPLDIINTLANKCPKEKVCAGSSPDGG